jgi:excisionase family DNA binding protein
MTNKKLPPPKPPTNRLLNVAEACQALGIGRSSYVKLCSSGALRTVFIGNRRLVPESELQSYVQRLLDEGR